MKSVLNLNKIFQALSKASLEYWWTWFFFIGPYLLDRVLKVFTSSISEEPVHFLFFGFFSSFSRLYETSAPEVSLYVTNSIVSVLFFILSIFVFIFINYIFTYKHLLIRISFSLALGGLSNFFIDLILTGEIINNMALIAGSTYLPFSAASIVFCAGFFMFIYFLVIDRKSILKKDSLRKTIFLKNRNQNHFILTSLSAFSLIYLIIAVLLLLFYISSINALSMDMLSAENKHSFLSVKHGLIKNFLLLVFLSYLIAVSVLVLLAVLYSHRIYGPVYGFQSYMRSLFEGNKKDSSFKTRKKDHFKELEKVAEYIRTRLIRKL